MKRGAARWFAPRSPIECPSLLCSSLGHSDQLCMNPQLCHAAREDQRGNQREKSAGRLGFPIIPEVPAGFSMEGARRADSHCSE